MFASGVSGQVLSRRERRGKSEDAEKSEPQIRKNALSSLFSALSLFLCALCENALAFLLPASNALAQQLHDRVVELRVLEREVDGRLHHAEPVAAVEAAPRETVREHRFVPDQR